MNKLTIFQSRMIWATVIFCYGGLLYLLIDERFEFHVWERLYWFWEAIAFILAFGTILALIPKKERWIVKPIFYYSIIRLLWEITFLITAWDINHPMAVITASIVMITGLGILLLKDLIVRCKQN